MKRKTTPLTKENKQDKNPTMITIRREFEDFYDTRTSDGEFYVGRFHKDVYHQCVGTTSRVVAEHFLDILLHRYSREILHNSQGGLFAKEYKKLACK